MSKKDEERQRHEYMLMEIRLSAEDVKEYVREAIKPLDKRVTSLEHWRTKIHGIAVAITGIATYIKGGHHLK